MGYERNTEVGVNGEYNTMKTQIGQIDNIKMNDDGTIDAQITFDKNHIPNTDINSVLQLNFLPTTMHIEQFEGKSFEVPDKLELDYISIYPRTPNEESK